MKEGQIAHLDHDRNNNSIDNLAWLCLFHHDKYDSKTSQAKGLTLEEVKHHRQSLYDFLRQEEEPLGQRNRFATNRSESWEPDRIHERLWTNLLEVTTIPESIYVAETEFRKPKELWEAVQERTSGNVQAPLLLSEGRIITFQDLEQPPWRDLCDLGTREEFETEEWSLSEDEDRRRHFVQLLNRCLSGALHPEVIYAKRKGYYYFRATTRLGDKRFSYRSRVKNTTATVFKGYSKKTKSGIAFYRHAAVEAAFRRYGGKWYVAINPTFHFTLDGEREDKFGAERLSKKKQLEHNSSVSGQVLMWAEYFKSRYKPLLPRPFTLQFGELATLETDFGIDERLWITPPLGGDSESKWGSLWDL